MSDAARWSVRLDGREPPPPERIGGKAWSIARMRRLGLPVPPAFAITTDACRAWRSAGRRWPEGLEEEVREAMRWLEQETGRRFGGAERPLLVAVRSGAAVSMPGMMDTVLNLGAGPSAEAALAAESGSAAFARDTHRRFVEMFARIVLRAAVPPLDPDADAREWHAQVAAAGQGDVPRDPEEQLRLAIGAVLDSWSSRRARRYRAHHGIPDDLGTAVTVQAMVFGNLDDRSGTGVLFSRDPLSGAPGVYGEYLPRAQGEDVVSGGFDPQPLSALAAALPDVHDELVRAAGILEWEHRDVQDIEFTVQRGRLYLLQSRVAKRAPAAAVRIAVDLVGEGILDEDEALARVSPEQVRNLLRPRLAQAACGTARVLARGDAACPGVGVGGLVWGADAVEREAAAGRPVVLAARTTSPEDVHGMLVARAVATELGGATSHAAVVSRSLGLPCVVGCGEGTLEQLAGREVTVDGEGGRVLEGALPIERPVEEDDPALRRLTGWARRRSPVEVYREGEPHPTGAVELDQRPGGEDPEKVAGLLEGAAGARGHALASDAGVAAAVAAGVRFLVVAEVLPALLAACAAARSGAGAATGGGSQGRSGQRSEEASDPPERPCR